MDIEHFACHPENLIGFLGLCLSAFGERAARFPPMANVAVGHGDQFYVMSFCRPHSGNATRLNLAVVWMRPEANNPKFTVIGRRRRGTQGRADCEEKERKQQTFHTIPMLEL